MTDDGSFLYVAGDGIAVFARDAATGKLTQPEGSAGCVSASGADGDGADTCSDGRVVEAVFAITLSADERFAYAIGEQFGISVGVSIFLRNPSTGELTQLPGSDGCATDNGESEDGAATCRTSAAPTTRTRSRSRPTVSTHTCPAMTPNR